MKEKNDDDNILLKEAEKEKEKTQEEEKKDSLELIKDHSKDKLIIKENNKKIDSFEILCKEKEFEDIAVDDFEDLSFKLIYENDHLLKHVISHVSEFLNKNAKNEHSNIIESLSNFINYDGFSEAIMNKILLYGIPENLPCLRPCIWKAFIGLYPLDLLEKWKDISTNKFSDYKKIIEKYNYYPNDIKEETDVSLLEQINKDLPRTRFDVPFFENKNKNNDKETNYDVLRRILFIYANERNEIGYVQGMNEIIAILFYIFSKDDNPFCKEYSESDAYYSLVILLDEIKDIFLMNNINYSQLFVTSQINEIKSILEKVEPELYNHFKEVDLELDNVVMRWILVLFAQEFTIDVAVNFWDRLFTQKNKMKFICYISSAIIKNNKEKIMKMDAGEIMEWAQQLQNKMNEMDINKLVKTSIEIQMKYNRRDSNNFITQ
jgi:hypothetical protein